MKTTESADIHDLLQAGYRYARALTSNPADARDFVHDAWLRVFGRYGRLPDRALLYRTIRNLYIDRYRRDVRFAHFSFDESHPESEHEPGSCQTPDIGDRQLERCLSRLRDIEREVLFLAVVEGYTAKEIASMLNRPRGSVLTLLQRARSRLRRNLQEDETGTSETASDRAVS